MRCGAALIFDYYGEVAAGISISGPFLRLPLDRIDAVSEVVRKKADILSR